MARSTDTNVIDLINTFFAFFFLQTALNTIKIAKALKNEVLPLDKLKALGYKYHTQSYFGLGFILSFIPGTEAFEARKALLEETLMNAKKLPSRFARLIPVTFFALPIIRTEVFFANGSSLRDSFLKIRQSFWEMIESEINYHPHFLNIGIFLLLLPVLMFELAKMLDAFHFSLALLLRDLLYLTLIPVTIGIALTCFLLEYSLRIIDTLVFDPLRFIIQALIQQVNFGPRTYVYFKSQDYEIIEHAYYQSFHQSFAEIAPTPDEMYCDEPQIEFNNIEEAKAFTSDNQYTVVNCGPKGKQVIAKIHHEYKQTSFFKLSHIPRLRDKTPHESAMALIALENLFLFFMHFVVRKESDDQAIIVPDIFLKILANAPFKLISPPTSDDINDDLLIEENVKTL